jgi:thioesterase domain-containing protein
MSMPEKKRLKYIESLEQSIPFIERTQIEVLELEPGYTKIRMPFEPNINHVGMMYAGALFTLAELPGGAIFVSTFDATKFFPIVRDVQIKFLKPALTDITVEVRLSEEDAKEIAARAEADGKANYEWECELKDAEENVVAVSTNRYQMRCHPPR